ncbi:MAG: hypothetical protein WEB60_07850 [Terrimicrobiaceae bacterium]
MKTRADGIFLVALLVLATALGVIGFRIADSTNLDTEPFDQGAYLGMAQSMKEDLLPARTDGTRNPLFPWLVTRFHNPDSPDFFAAGKRLNVVFAVLGVFCLGVAAKRRMGHLASWNLAAVGGLGALLPISTFFGAEVLFYLFFVGMWVAALDHLRRPHVVTGLLLGVFAGLAYLAKPSTGPFLAAFAGFLILLILVKLVWKNPPAWFLAPDWRTSAAILGLVAALGSYFVIISPRLESAQRTFGSAFYSLPSFWFWADDWKTCVEKYANCTEYGLSKLPPEEWPTAANYFRRNSPSAAWERLMGGTLIKVKQFVIPDGKLPWKAENRGKPKRMVLPARGWYLVLFGMLAVVMVVVAKGRPLSDPGGIAALAFGAGVFCLFTLAYGWYHVIGPGPRFVMMFYIPLCWSFFASANASAQDHGSAMLLTFFHRLLSVALLWRVGELLLNTNFEKISHAF